MSTHRSGPGKTAPKLLQDFLAFDPLRTGQSGTVLANHNPPVGEGQQLAKPIGSCQHEYTTKHKQSVLPPLDLRPDGTTKFRLAAVCKKCRIHADVHLDYKGATDPCPNSSYPLHHFQRLTSVDEVGQSRIKYGWQCSAPQCQAILEVSYRQARIYDQEKDLLINTEYLKRRYEAVVQQDPSREGIRQATPMEALSRLRKYTRDALDPRHDRRSFPANNKRFMEAFGPYGQDCRPLLERLGFKYADDEWALPNPDTIDDRFAADGTSHREFLEDVEIELLAWMYKLSADTGAANTAAAEGWPSAIRDLERTLSAQGYQRHASLRRPGTANEQNAYFASLGSLPDFADNLVEFAYDRQAMCDPERLPYYFECLQVISESRQTEQLQMKVATLESQDLVSRRDLHAAYRYLNIPQSEASKLDDQRVLELFQAQQPDLGPAGAEEARQALYRIGTARQSQILINASRQSVETYDDALSWLGNGADKNTPDDNLIAIVAAKVAESKSNEEIAQKAIATIARERKSNMLNNWLTTGRTDGYTMDVNEALRYLNIEQNISDIEPTVLPILFDSARKDRPGDTVEKAISAIQSFLANQNSAGPRAPEAWPVGLTSHGNTCYLNSLLQYYFSVKPLREMVMNYNQYKLDTTKYTEKQERVGQRKISMVEIKGGQRFAEDLVHLFQRMIKEPSSAVKPEEDLVCRAFLEPKDYALLASDVTSATVTENAVDHKLTDAPTGEEASAASASADRHLSNASSVTLQGEEQDVNMTNNEKPPTPPDSPKGKAMEKQPSDGRPPLPPRAQLRRFSTSTKEEALRLAKYNATQQQDVTEVHDGIMFRLRSGMMPRSVDEFGEQEDPLRDMYAIGMTERHIERGVEGKPIPQTDSSITVNVPTEPTDIYSALDEVFDLQPYGNRADVEAYKSIRHLPPVLQISMPRIGFDRSRGGTFKSEEMIKLEDELYMDRYCDASHVDIAERRRRCWGWRKQLRSLKKEQKALTETGVDQLDGPTAVSQSAQYLQNVSETNNLMQEAGLEGIPIDEQLPSVLATEAHEQSKRLVSLQTEIESLQAMLETQFQDLKQLKYRLAAVFIHRGSHGHGHYWVYIHDFVNNVWRNYNDERVEEVSNLADVFEAKTWQQGTPTYAVYVRDEEKERLVQPLCREPERVASMAEVSSQQWEDQQQQQPQQGEDVQMKDPSWNHQPRSDASQRTVAPNMTEEGGQQSWDETRQVAQADW
ncbi:cysteine proteinase [Hortaea werneckii]|nr:cysteine proteinase [Hortaea werneckii]